MGKPIFALTLEEARAELLRVAPGTWRQDMLRARIEQIKRNEVNGGATREGTEGDQQRDRPHHAVRRGC